MTARAARHPRSLLAALSACTVLVVGFVASINLAVPALAASTLRPSSAELMWVVDAYVVLFACLVIPAGALGDRVGRRGVLLGGLLLLALGALVSAGAPGVAVLLGGRVVSGVGAAAVLPNALAVLVDATPPPRRPHAIAVWAAMSGIGGVVGNVGGGALLSLGSWRWLFVAVAPLALACAAWVTSVAPRVPAGTRRLDLPGTAVLTAATLALLVGIIEGPEQGWRSPLVVGGFAAAGVLAVLWVALELRTAEPLLDPRVLGMPELRAACLGMLVVFFGMFGFFYLNASLLQYGRGYSVLQTGFAVVPMTLPPVVGTRWVPRLAARLGTSRVLAAAFVVVAAGLAGLAATVRQPYPAYAGCLVVVGVGITLALPALTATIATALPPGQAGVAGGLQATTRELGSALGVAVIGTLVAARFAGELGTGARPPSVSVALAEAPGRHDAVVAAYTSAAATALAVVALVVLVAGALVVAELRWSARRAQASPAA